jgi:hypothetical protein
MEQVRITPEQEQADKNFIHNLKSHIADWKSELEWVERELIDQALLDAKAGQRSARYNSFEKRESDLKAMIEEAQKKVTLYAERPTAQTQPFNREFSSLVNNTLNQIKP